MMMSICTPLAELFRLRVLTTWPDEDCGSVTDESAVLICSLTGLWGEIQAVVVSSGPAPEPRPAPKPSASSSNQSASPSPAPCVQLVVPELAYRRHHRDIGSLPQNACYSDETDVLVLQVRAAELSPNEQAAHIVNIDRAGTIAGLIGDSREAVHDRLAPLIEQGQPNRRLWRQVLRPDVNILVLPDPPHHRTGIPVALGHVGSLRVRADPYRHVKIGISGEGLAGTLPSVIHRCVQVAAWLEKPGDEHFTL